MSCSIFCRRLPMQLSRSFLNFVSTSTGLDHLCSIAIEFHDSGWQEVRHCRQQARNRQYFQCSEGVSRKGCALGARSWLKRPLASWDSRIRGGFYNPHSSFCLRCPLEVVGMRRTRTRICNMRIGLCNIAHFTVRRSDSCCKGVEPTFRRTGRCLLVSIAVGGLLLTRCGAFDAHFPPARRQPWGASTGDLYARCPGSTSARAVHASKITMTTTTTSKNIHEEEVKTAKYLGETSCEDPSLWEGHEHGFDWYLERTRRSMTGKGGGFSPLRMTFWRPMEEQPEELSPWDSFYIMLRNLGQMIGLPSVDNAPVAKIETYKGSWWTFLQKVSNGRLEDLAGGPLFLMLEKYFRAEGPVYKLAFGPRSFIVVSDPVMAKHVLKSSVGDYDKGVLAAILKPIMGKGLIPADPETWKVRRRAIVPGFHKAWLNRMMRLFAECASTLVVESESAAKSGAVLDMEEKFCSLSLDIIGRAVFNFEFDSVTEESPVIKAVYRVLREAEHRSSSFVPYWKLPFAERWMASQVEFTRDMNLLNEVLDKLIQKALDTQQMCDVEELERRDLDAIDDPSLLRFLIDMRGEDTSSKQLRDDLMTMLIAGHETTAAMLTWTLFNLVQSPEYLAKVQAEIDGCLGPDGSRTLTFDDLPGLLYTRLALIEALRLYPEPPVIIRRALKETELPRGSSDGPVKLVKGTDVFISTWNLHRNPTFWDRPSEYRPDRFLSEFKNSDVADWKGYTPKTTGGLYPNEVDADFAFLPFGGGNRKCVGDQFAMMEATVTLAMLLRKLDFQLVGSPSDVGMVTGATIHTANGLKMTASLRAPSEPQPQPLGRDVSVGAHGHEVNGHHEVHEDVHAAVTAVKAVAAAAAAAASKAHGANGTPHVNIGGTAGLSGSGIRVPPVSETNPTGSKCPMHEAGDSAQ